MPATVRRRCAVRRVRLFRLRQTLSELTGPVYGHESIGPLDDDLTRNGAKTGEPLGERIIVTGRVLDETGRPVRNTLVEIWQANAAGRYVHHVDQHEAPLDPNFFGGGRCLPTRRPLPFHDHQARRLSLAEPPQRLAAEPHPFLAVRADYRDAARHPDVFSGRSAACNSTRSTSRRRRARERLISTFSLDVTEPGFALGYVFDIVLRGPARLRWRPLGELDGIAGVRSSRWIRRRSMVLADVVGGIAKQVTPGEHVEIRGPLGSRASSTCRESDQPSRASWRAR